ncbi:MAG: methyltransferase domain-containing protein [Acidimicrobiales bacterium]
MSDAEFESAFAKAGRRLAALDRAEAIAAACRGSGNPALLAWLAESAGLEPGARVMDVGAGLGGPAAWLTDHFDWRVLAADPITAACDVASSVFDLPTLVSRGDALPACDDAFDACLLLGVLSVVDEPGAVLREVARVAPVLLSISYVSTSGIEERIGGSRFPSRAQLHHLFVTTGWSLDAGPAAPALPPPPTWQNGSLVESEDDEIAVSQAIGEGRVEPLLLASTRNASVR